GARADRRAKAGADDGRDAQVLPLFEPGGREAQLLEAGEGFPAQGFEPGAWGVLGARDRALEVRAVELGPLEDVDHRTTAPDAVPAPAAPASVVPTSGRAS